jgi:hypothetical protein
MVVAEFDNFGENCRLDVGKWNLLLVVVVILLLLIVIVIIINIVFTSSLLAAVSAPTKNLPPSLETRLMLPLYSPAVSAVLTLDILI